MKHDAIYSLYSNVVTIDGDDNPYMMQWNSRFLGCNFGKCKRN